MSKLSVQAKNSFVLWTTAKESKKSVEGVESRIKLFVYV